MLVDGAAVIDAWVDQAPATYTATRSLTAGDRAVTVEYYENGGGAVAQVNWQLTAAANSAPVTTIGSPTASTTWKVGDVISFSGSATDAEDGALPASELSWTLVQQHCPSNCHQHTVQSFAGVAGGSFAAPDHEYPSYLELRLTATDSGGAQSTASVALQPRTTTLTFASNPSGLSLVFNAASVATPFTRTVIVGSNNSISAPTPQTLNANSYQFSAWSDQGAATHNITAAAAATTFTATYQTSTPTQCPVGQFLARYYSGAALTGSPLVTRCELGINSSWGNGSPAAGVPVDGFSVRWTGQHTFSARSYTFTARADDGVRVFVDGVRVINAWVDQSPTTYRTTRTMTAGTHTVTVDYYERTGGAVATVSW